MDANDFVQAEAIRKQRIEREELLALSNAVYMKRTGDWQDYASDMNAAVELLRECEGEFNWNGEEWRVEVSGYLYAYSDNPARAICEVWLQWRAVLHGQG